MRDSWSLANGRWQYLGLEFDNETGSLHTHARECFNLEGFFNKLDRFAFKYPSQTPYGYAKQNPFRYHDASGDTIRIIGDAKFIEAVQNLINILKESDEGIKTMIEDLELSENNHYILNWDKKRPENETRAADGKWKFKAGQKKDENHISTGTMIFFNPFSPFSDKESEKMKDPKDIRQLGWDTNCLMRRILTKVKQIIQLLVYFRCLR